MNKRNKSIFALMVILGSTSILGACSNSAQEENSNKKSALTKIPMDGSFTVDVNNPKETIGDADYVFVGQVDQIEDTVYKNPVTLETKNGPEEISTPYTNFKVTVLKNIKGSLITDSTIPIQKTGGVSKDNSALVLYEDDFLPEKDKSYIFLAYVQEDGSILVSGPNSNKYVEDIKKGETSKALKNYKSILNEQSVDLISSYEKSYKNELKTSRERFTSDFEKK